MRFLLILLCVSLSAAADDVFQWAIDVPLRAFGNADVPSAAANGAPQRAATATFETPPRAYLWIPEDCGRVRAVVFAQHNMEEIQILRDEGFRRALSELGVAEVWCSPPYDLQFGFDKGAGDVFQLLMSALADKSGYEELSSAPVIYMGHSAAASAPYYFAAWQPSRTLACLSVSGQWPYYRGDFAPDIWGGRTIDYVPCLETMGEYENALTWADEGLRQRAEHPLTPLSMLACPAEGHFASTPEKAEYLAFYIRKAMQYRLGDDNRLLPIVPTTSGWLSERWRGDSMPVASPAPVSDYQGDPRHAFWFFDEEHVAKTLEYQSKHRNKKVQLLGYVQNGKPVEQRNIHLQVPLALTPDSFGIFTLQGVFMDTVPGGSPRPSRWADLPVGSAIGHPSSDELIDIEVICGPVKKIGKNRFALHFGRDRIRNGTIETAFAATHPGDEVYKPMVQQAVMTVPAIEKFARNGAPVTFEALNNNASNFGAAIIWELSDSVFSVGAAPLMLKASVPSGLPVHFTVTEGPAYVEGNTLYFTKIPPRAKYPVEVRIEAWYYDNIRAAAGKAVKGLMIND